MTKRFNYYLLPSLLGFLFSSEVAIAQAISRIECGPPLSSRDKSTTSIASGACNEFNSFFARVDKITAEMRRVKTLSYEDALRKVEDLQDLHNRLAAKFGKGSELIGELEGVIQLARNQKNNISKNDALSEADKKERVADFERAAQRGEELLRRFDQINDRLQRSSSRLRSKKNDLAYQEIAKGIHGVFDQAEALAFDIESAIDKDVKPIVREIGSLGRPTS